MLNSCGRSCEVLRGSRLLTVTKSDNSRCVVARTQLRQPLRNKSSNTRGQFSRSANRKHTPSATGPAAPSHSKFVSPKTTTQTQRESQSFKSKLQARSHEGNEAGLRPLLTDPVKPTPNQDLISTRPAELETVLPPEQDGGGIVPITARASYLYRLGKSYVSFYKTGVKNIWYNRKEYNEIKARLGAYSLEDAALYGGQAANQFDNGLGVEVEKIPTVTRREYQLCLRTKHDLGKLIPFGIVFAICGEFTPLVILALGSSVVPYTCRIPKQVQHDRRWFEKRLEARTPEKVAKNNENMDLGIGSALESVNTLAFLNGVSPFANLPPVIGRVLCRLWVYPRLRRRGLEILADTVLIRREGGFGVLEAVELYEYANRFFCPQLIMASRAELKHKGTVSWDPKFASSLITVLEKHARMMLTENWGQAPGQARYQRGLIFDADTLSHFLAAEKVYQETGELPSDLRAKAKHP